MDPNTQRYLLASSSGKKLWINVSSLSFTSPEVISDGVTGTNIAISNYNDYFVGGGYFREDATSTGFRGSVYKYSFQGDLSVAMEASNGTGLATPSNQEFNGGCLLSEFSIEYVYPVGFYGQDTGVVSCLTQESDYATLAIPLDPLNPHGLLSPFDGTDDLTYIDSAYMQGFGAQQGNEYAFSVFRNNLDTSLGFVVNNLTTSPPVNVLQGSLLDSSYSAVGLSAVGGVIHDLSLDIVYSGVVFTSSFQTPTDPQRKIISQLVAPETGFNDAFIMISTEIYGSDTNTATYVDIDPELLSSYFTQIGVTPVVGVPALPQFFCNQYNTLLGTSTSICLKSTVNGQFLDGVISGVNKLGSEHVFNVCAVFRDPSAAAVPGLLYFQFDCTNGQVTYSRFMFGTTELSVSKLAVNTENSLVSAASFMDQTNTKLLKLLMVYDPDEGPPLGFYCVDGECFTVVDSPLTASSDTFYLMSKGTELSGTGPVEEEYVSSTEAFQSPTDTIFSFSR